MGRSKLAVFMGLASPGQIGIPRDIFGGLHIPRRGAKWRRKRTGPSTAKSYFDRRRGGNPKGAY